MLIKLFVQNYALIKELDVELENGLTIITGVTGAGKDFDVPSCHRSAGEACEGQGQKKVEMYFLPDIYVECEECHGKRYSKEVLEITYKDKNIADVLEMTVEEAMEFFLI